MLDRLSAGWRGYALIALITLAAVLPGFASLPVLDRDEARFAQATRQMLETGDFIRINVQEEARNKKPIGIHWMQAAAVAATAPITGNLNTIWAYRLPSLLGVLLAALATFWGGRVLVGARAALIGACLLPVTLLLATEGIIAKTDAMLCGLIVLMMAALALLREGAGAPRGLALLFWGALGLGVLVKGPVAPMVAALTLLTLFAWERRARWMAPLLWAPGPILAALIVAPWFIAIQVATDGAFLREAISVDLAPKLAAGAEGHAGPPGYHVALLILSFFPATIGLAPGLVVAWRAIAAPANNSAQGGARFLIAWAAPTWIVFELLGTKLPHYVLPAFPALALLAGAGLVAAYEGRWRVSSLVSITLFAVGAALLVALMAYGSTYLPGDDSADLRRAVQTALWGGAGALIALVVVCMARAPMLRVSAAILFALASMYVLRERIAPEARSILISAEVVEALDRAGLGRAPLVVAGYRETSLVFMTDTRTHLFGAGQARAAAAAAQAGGAALVSCSERDAFERALGARGLRMSAGETIEGLNYANGDEVCLGVGEINAHQRQR